MTEKEFSNLFKFSVTQGDILLCEVMFDGNKFNPFTRRSINIRDILPHAIIKLQKVLSRRSYDVIFDVGLDSDSEEKSYNLLKYHQTMISKYPQQFRKNMYYSPTPIIKKIEKRTIRGVECKMGLYINDNPIVERQFYVDRFNPIAKHSLDVTYTVSDITETIREKIKRNDIKNMWDDYDLSDMKGLSITQIRELSIGNRQFLLRGLKR